MRLSPVSLLYLTGTLICMTRVWRIVVKTTSLESEFPLDIFEEIRDRDWSSQNQEEGSYQTITPGVFHMVHADLIYGLSFVESCIIKSAFQNSVLDSVFIHAQVGVLNSSYLDELMSDPVLEEKIMIMETDFGVENSDKLSPKQIVSAGLRYRRTVPIIFSFILLEELCHLVASISRCSVFYISFN